MRSVRKKRYRKKKYTSTDLYRPSMLRVSSSNLGWVEVGHIVGHVMLLSSVFTLNRPFYVPNDISTPKARAEHPREIVQLLWSQTTVKQSKPNSRNSSRYKASASVPGTKTQQNKPGH